MITKKISIRLQVWNKIVREDLSNSSLEEEHAGRKTMSTTTTTTTTSTSSSNNLLKEPIMDDELVSHLYEKFDDLIDAV